MLCYFFHLQAIDYRNTEGQVFSWKKMVDKKVLCKWALKHGYHLKKPEGKTILDRMNEVSKGMEIRQQRL